MRRWWRRRHCVWARTDAQWWMCSRHWSPRAARRRAAFMNLFMSGADGLIVFKAGTVTDPPLDWPPDWPTDRPPGWPTDPPPIRYSLRAD